MKNLFMILAVVACAGCHHEAPKPRACAPGTRAKVELRDGSGTLLLAVKPAPVGKELDLCDGKAARIGQVTQAGDVLTVLDASGALVLRLSAGRLHTFPDADGQGPKGPRLRTHRDGANIRVLRPDGVAYGELALGPGGRVTITDQASKPVANLTLSDGRTVIAGTDGSTRFFVHPETPAAAVFALPELSLAERTGLFLLWSR